MGLKQHPGWTFDLSKLRKLLRALLDALWPDGKHQPGVAVDVPAALRHLQGLDAEAASQLRALSRRLDAFADMSASGQRPTLEEELEDIFRRARKRGVDRAAVEKAVAEQLNAAFRKSKR